MSEALGIEGNSSNFIFIDGVEKKNANIHTKKKKKKKKKQEKHSTSASEFKLLNN